MGFVLLLHKVDSPEQKRSQCLGYQVAPSLKNVGNLVKQGVGIEPGRAGKEGEDILVTVSHPTGSASHQGGHRLGCFGKRESFRSNERFCRLGESRVLHHDLMDEVSSQRLLVKEIQRQ